MTAQQAIRHIKPQIWEQVNRLLIKKSIREFTHEGLISPCLERKAEQWNKYTLKTTCGIVYSFVAQEMELNHLRIQAASIQKETADSKQILPLDALLFIKEFSAELGLEGEALGVYLEEITSTLYGSAYKYSKKEGAVQELVHQDYQSIEQAMLEGHPGFIANNGRMGFDGNDYQKYAPEAGNPFPVLWLAGRKEKVSYAGTAQWAYAKLIEQELGKTKIAAFQEAIQEQGYDVKDYYFIPVHPWQWFNKLSNVFAPEIAQGNLLYLGESDDQYLAQQSIRTLFNTTQQQKLYTKTSLSILNMGFSRGLPTYYLSTAPDVANWLNKLLGTDVYLSKTGFQMLDEVASICYVNSYYKELDSHSPYNRMLAALWRESPFSKIQQGQKVMTMAALLHVDQYGEALLPELIRASNLTTQQWLSNYLKAYLSPLLHCFYQYDLVFMPHGENLILILDDYSPCGVFLKDITEEATILNPEIELPSNLKRIYAPVPEEVKLLSIFIDVFDGFFRFLSEILVEYMDFPEHDFWKLVALNIEHYQQQFPNLKDKFKRYDLFAEDFQLSCLNRLQLNNNKQMVDSSDPTGALQFVGRLKNPIAAYKTINKRPIELNHQAL